MQFSKKNFSVTSMKEYKVYGCKAPTAEVPQPQVFVSNVFAKNVVVARSKFFRILNSQHKIKASNGVILKTEEVPQDNDFELKNYGITFVYRTRTGLANGYREVRHINRVLGVTDFIQDFCATHKIRSGDIYIIKMDRLEDDEVRRTRVLCYTGEDVKFPVFKKVPNTKKDFVPATADIFN